MAFTAAVLFGIGTYLLLQRKLSRLIIGLGLIGHGANVVFVTATRRGAAAAHRHRRPRRLRRSAPAVARAHGHRHQLRRHRAAAGAGLPQLAADRRRRGGRRHRRPQRRPRLASTPRSPTPSDRGGRRPSTDVARTGPSREGPAPAPDRAAAAGGRAVHPRRRLAHGPADHRARPRSARSCRSPSPSSCASTPTAWPSSRPATGRHRSASRSSPTGCRRSCC